MIVSNQDIKTIYFCPKKAKLDIQGENRSLSDFLFTTEAFGCYLSIKIDEVFSSDPFVVKIYKTGRKISEYHMLEGAFIGYVLESNGVQVKDIVFESPHYSVSVNWRPYVTKMLSLISYFCEESEFKIAKTHLCRFCKYSDHCFHGSVNIDSFAFLHGVKGRTLEKLTNIGITSLKELIARASEIKKEFGEEKAMRMIYHAQSIIENRPIVFKAYEKLHDGIYLDIESYTPFDFDYLFGILENERYIPFLANNPTKEKYIFENVVKYLEKRQKLIYHFHNYEINRFKKLSRKYNIPVSKDLLSRFVDVYKIYSNHIALPIPSYSLKSIARFFGFNWRTALNGLAVINYYREYLATKNKAVLKEILIYNEDDVRATAHIVKKLNELNNN
jgi:uncharacterized protein